MSYGSRPLTVADWDIRPGRSWVEGEDVFGSGVVLESTRRIMGLCTFRQVDWPVSRGRDGWAITPLCVCKDDNQGTVVRIESLYIPRGRSVTEVLGLVRAVQRHVCEQGAQWVVAVVNPMEFCTTSPNIQDCQMALQQGRFTSPVCWLFWELGFVDVIVEDAFLAFLWRNPAW